MQPSFVDSNKRTAHVCYRVFPALNGANLVASDEDKYVSMIVLAEGSLPDAELADWLRRHIDSGAKNRMNEPRARYALKRSPRRLRPWIQVSGRVPVTP